MTGNPKSSPWRSTPRVKRGNKGIQLTLSPEAVKALDEMAGDGSRSAFVSELILEEKRRRG